MLRLNKSNKGFLLFEVAVAVVILSIGITIVLQSFNSAIMSVKLIRDYTTSMFLLEQKMVELEMADNSQLIDREGSFEGEFSKFSWKIDSALMDKLPLDKTGVSVLWGTKTSVRKFSVQTYLEHKQAV